MPKRFSSRSRVFDFRHCFQKQAPTRPFGGERRLGQSRVINPHAIDFVFS
jgi:hypothetical protein